MTETHREGPSKPEDWLTKHLISIRKEKNFLLSTNTYKLALLFSYSERCTAIVNNGKEHKVIIIYRVTSNLDLSLYSILLIYSWIVFLCTVL